MSDDEEHQKTDSGSSNTYPIQAGQLKKGSFVCIKEFPCKIVDTSTSKTGKHGHAKIHIVGVDIFTGKKYEENCPTSHNMEVPNITRIEYQLVDIDHDGFLSLMDSNGNSKNDVKLPEGEEGDNLKAALKQSQSDSSSVLVSILTAMGQEAVASFKVEK